MLTLLSLSGYRNLKPQTVRFAPGLNLIFGRNGSGKSNLLEAIGLFSLARSCRGAKDQELVAFGQNLAEVIGDIEDQKKNAKSPSASIITAKKG